MIKIGSTIHMEMTDKKDIRRFRSKILDMESGDIFIDFPVDGQNRKPGFFIEGTQFKIWFIGGDQAIYLFESEVKGIADRQIPMLVLKGPIDNNYIRIQRRQYVRVETMADVAVYSEGGKFAPFTTLTSDLSGGGLSLHLPDDCSLGGGERFKVYLALPFQSGETVYIEAAAEFIRSKFVTGRAIGSAEFKKIEDADRQKIVRYCYERQLIINKKEKKHHSAGQCNLNNYK
ncbi:flagellar brake protein [Salipaludibacillus aurantiacus]|uniref:C-di-GMP-binding flagellar brake protein YcgR, contains PilZNR and PilZ domains n=1 Tax=Salipaludibacillus aurantiacus TaxID=1601833 RepID=A0A1H9P9R6_9BACI|nr:flagellar brake domain-containing protein [Salipaludibacillus aurantiacus]SER44984.1 c-di-GMP-binding flagellar brake protein YcgR, contains PilZNR and PilZ domains [Salipaludibacillus aurantiacus]